MSISQQRQKSLLQNKTGCVPGKTSSPAVARIADHTGCQWPSRSSKVDDFQVI